jgi:hypothetical protein
MAARSATEILDVTLERAGARAVPVLRRLMQLYLYDLGTIDGWDISPDGRFGNARSIERFCASAEASCRVEIARFSSYRSTIKRGVAVKPPSDCSNFPGHLESPNWPATPARRRSGPGDRRLHARRLGDTERTHDDRASPGFGLAGSALCRSAPTARSGSVHV